MSVDAVKWAIKQKTGDVTAKSVLRMLAWHHNPETGLCCPSIPLLQEECDIKSDNTVKAALKRLVAAGLIASEREMANGAIKRTRYTLIGFDPSNIGGGADIEGGSIIEGGANITPGEGQILPLPSLKDCPSVPQILPPKEKIEREEEKSKVSCALPAGSSAADLCPSVDEFGLTNDFPVEAPKTKKQTKTKKGNAEEVDFYDLQESMIRDWKTHRGTTAKITQTVVDAFRREAEKVGKTLEFAVRYSIEHNWRGFFAKWYLKEEAKSGGESISNVGTLPDQSRNPFYFPDGGRPNRKTTEVPEDYDATAEASDLVGRMLG